MSRKGLCLALAVTISSLFLVQAAKANLVQNGGFETGDFTNWTQIPASSGSDFGVSGGSAHSGAFGAFFAATGATGDAILQVIPTVAGVSYTFDFWLLHFSTNQENDFSAIWDGNVIFSLTNSPSFGFTHFSFTEVANSANIAIAFSGREVPSEFILDDVAVNPAAETTVPEPGTLLLLFSGLGSMGLAGWRKLRSSR